MLVLKGVTKVFREQAGQTVALDGISLHVARGRRLALIGPSGCGKTSVLRCIAGLESPDAGEIHIDGSKVFCASARHEVPPWKRSVGMVFQAYALWPHMSVLENVMFPLGNQKNRAARTERMDRARQVLSSVFLDGFEDRLPAQLSGGQQQRVALARSLVTEPKVLLLDEPLSGLDQVLRDRTRQEIVEILERASITTVFVTHDHADGFWLAHDIALMDAGQIIQVGTPQSVYEWPKNLRAANILGGGNQIDCRMERPAEQGSCRAYFPRSPQYLTLDVVPGGDTATILIRPEACAILSGEGRGGKANTLIGRIEKQTFLGPVGYCTVNVDGSLLRFPADNGLNMSPGLLVHIAVNPSRVHVYPRAPTA